MDCRSFRMLIQKYHDGDLSLAEMAEYENHRAGCAECARLDGQFAGVFSALGSIGHFEPSPEFNARVMAHVDVARYRVSAFTKVMRAVRGFWRGLPAPVRATGLTASVFALFVSVYTPFLMMMLSALRRTAEYAMSSLYIIRRLFDDPDMLMSFLISLEKYRVAARILLKTVQRQAEGVPMSAFVLTAGSVVLIMYFVIKGTRGLWKKGETHVGVL